MTEQDNHGFGSGSQHNMLHQEYYHETMPHVYTEATSTGVDPIEVTSRQQQYHGPSTQLDEESLYPPPRYTRENDPLQLPLRPKSTGETEGTQARPTHHRK